MLAAAGERLVNWRSSQVLKKFFILGSLLAVGIASAATTTIDFEGFTAGDTIATVNATTTPLGVTFGLVNGDFAIVDYTALSPLSGKTAQNNYSESYAGPPVLTATFGVGVYSDNLSIDVWDTNQDVNVLIYNGATLLQTVIFSGATTGTATFTPGFTVTSLSVVDISTNAKGDGFNVDNLVFEAVPEPGTYLMMGAGLGLLGLLRRRRA
ncbi:MAG: PEP-CTERM sorting domain-containing protein [Acidobacteriia bacterium]|nr:PEP-CTERM sorting domain-containing protein [Terriglobia bacterium]